MSEYKLIYFNARGRAELSRLIFAYAGQKYEDFRFEREDWPKYKETTPFGLAPVLEIDGVTVSQSKTIARFLANRFGLAGKTDLERAKADSIVEYVQDDLLNKLIQIHRETDESKKDELKKAFSETFWPSFLTSLSNQLNGDYFVGDSVTWADIAVMDALPWVKVMGLDSGLEKFPKIQAHYERMRAIPSLQEWIKQRPKTDR